MKKRILSFLMAAVMAVMSVSACFTAFAETYPYLEYLPSGSPIYHRLSYGEDLAFQTGYDEIVEQTREALLSHSESIDFYFATNNEKYSYTYNSGSDYATAVQSANLLVNDILNDVFEVNSDYAAIAGGGEYLFNSILNIGVGENGYLSVGSTTYGIYTSAMDTPTEGNDRYYTFHINIKNIEYYTTLEQEKMVEDFALWFSQNYLVNCESEYEIVKTIYDFVVRNAVYDWGVYRRNTSSATEEITPERYNIAHSAYGAIFGNILDQIDENTSMIDFYDMFDKKQSVTEEYIPVKYNQGMAVCEGYSKLFYYLCIYNGIDCHIVDGDYTADSGKNNDPHEWNYVYLQDERHNGYHWYQVDCTKAAQKSVKEIDYNSYEYFLCGTENVFFDNKSHQQPYENKGFGLKEQLFDWYADENRCNEDDYLFAYVKLGSENLSQGHIIRRTTYYSEIDDERYVYIFCDADGTQLIEVDENGLVLTETTGFIYTGHDSTFDIILPYLVHRINVLDDGTVSEGEYTMPLTVKNVDTGEVSDSACDVGSYSVTVNGGSDTSVLISFNISPRDMSPEAVDDDAVVIAYDHANYTGNPIHPYITVTDAYRNRLQENRDYTVHYMYKGTTEVSQIKEIGEYKIVIRYQGNYFGEYYLDFTMGKIDLSNMSYSPYSFEYLPDYEKRQRGISDPIDYFNSRTTTGIKVGDVTIHAGQDYSLMSNGGLDYGNEGTITLTGVSTSNNLISGTSVTVPYKVDQKFDITNYFRTSQVADTNTVNKVYYTGNPVKPTKFDVVDKYLVQGKDYKIVGYRNNVDMGYAYVTIQGINGCTGTVELQFYINRPNNLVDPSASGNTIKLSKSSFVYNGKAQTPTLTFKNASGKAVSTFYYTVSYKNNVNVGTATAVLTLRNGYSGTFSFQFTILPKATSMKSISAGKKCVTVKWNKQSAQTTGYQLQYGTSANYKGAKTITIAKPSTVSKKITKLKSKKICYVRVRTYKTVGGKKYYSAWSKGLGIKVK